VHDAVAKIASVPRGVSDASGAIRRGFESAGDADGEVPVVGESLSGGLHDAREGAGGEIAEIGRQGEEDVDSLADFLGALSFLLPAPSCARAIALRLSCEAVAQNLARWRNLQQGAVLPGGCRTTLKQDSGQGTAQIRFMRASRRCCRPRRRRCTRGRHPRFAGCVGGINNEDAPRRLCATACTR
jgi:hypothetical protein